MYLRMAKAKQSKAKQEEQSSRSRAPATMQSTRIISAHRTSCRRVHCVALRGDTASQPVSIDGAPLGRIGTAGALQHSALRRFFSVSYAEKGQGWPPKSQTNLLAPGGIYGDVTRKTMSSLFFRLSEMILSPVPLP